MIAFYAMGGGWGHLTRIQTFIANAGILGPFKIITANPDVKRFFDLQSTIYIPATKRTTKEELTSLLKAALAQFQFSDCYIDVFPNGILAN